MLDGLFAGLDVSTQSCKLVVIDGRSGATVHIDTVSYDRDLPHFGTEGGTIPGLGERVSESDPRMWIEAVDLVLQRLRASKAEPHDIRCLAVSGQQHGLVALDARGALARPHAKLWNDFSTAEECEILTERLGGPARMIEEIGNTQRAGYTAPKVLHMLRHEPDTYHRASTLFLVHNYINWYLTGGAQGGVAIMEPGDTSGTALWSPVRGAWSRRVIEAIDPALDQKLPPVAPSDRCIGLVSPAIAAVAGLSPTCRVDAGSGDNMYGAIGTGNFSPGIVTISLGTSGTAYTFLESPYVDPEGEIAAFCDSTGHHLPLLCVSNMANGYDAVLDRFGLSHEDFDARIQTTAAGNDGRLILPWYQGERTPDLPAAAPLYFGFGVDDFGPDRLCRAVLEGHILNLWSGFSRMPVEPTTIRLTGGLSRSLAWRQTIADVFEVETVPVEGEGAALGAAIHAAWVWSKEEGHPLPLAEVAAPFIPIATPETRHPIPKNAATYRRLKRLFQALSDRARGRPSEDPFRLRAQLLGSAGPGSDGRTAQ